jgi:hypothetical protein
MDYIAIACWAFAALFALGLAWLLVTALAGAALCCMYLASVWRGPNADAIAIAKPARPARRAPR